MAGKINFYLLEYTLGYISRYKYKNIFIFTVMTLLVALLASTLFISNAMKLEYNSIIDNYPDIVITNEKAMREIPVDETLVDDILQIRGVSNAFARVWGKYYFDNGDTNFVLIGRDEFQSYANPLLSAIGSIEPNSMLISEGVKKSLDASYYSEYFNFIKSDGTFKKISISNTFKSTNFLENSSYIIMNKMDAKEIFQYGENEATDIGVIVANKSEVAFIGAKIRTLFPNVKLSVKDDLRVQYENIYNLRSGFFLTIFIITFFTFFIIIYDKVSGLNSEQKREIGILKALGWKVGDVLNSKLYEGIIISCSSYISGVLLAFFYVYLLHAPLLKKIFLNNYDLMHDFNIHFMIDYETLALLFFLTVPVYIAATIIPSWRVATLEADEVMR